MKERPILFSGPMVRALLEGRKTQTRRVVKPQPPAEVTDIIANGAGFVASYPNRAAIKPFVYRTIPRYGVRGDHLWVRESFCVGWPAGPEGVWSALRPSTCTDSDRRAFYRATTPPDPADEPQRRWTPSIHMPRWACRLTLEITDVRVQRLQEISEEDAQAEGPHQHPDYPEKFYHTWREAFRHLFDDVNAARGSGYTWDSNPWVWALTFEVVK